MVGDKTGFLAFAWRRSLLEASFWAGLPATKSSQTDKPRNARAIGAARKYHHERARRAYSTGCKCSPRPPGGIASFSLPLERLKASLIKLIYRCPLPVREWPCQPSDNQSGPVVEQS